MNVRAINFGVALATDSMRQYWSGVHVGCTIVNGALLLFFNQSKMVPERIRKYSLLLCNTSDMFNTDEVSLESTLGNSDN